MNPQTQMHICERVMRRSGPAALIGWIAAVVLMTHSIARDYPDQGRLSILVGMFALALTCSHLASQVIARLTQILALFHDDVPLVEPKHVADLTSWRADMS